MSKNGTDSDGDDPSIDRMTKLLAVIFFIALISILLAFIAYFNKFGKLSDESSDWGTFGDFIGGLLNPLLSFFGLIALLLTIILQGGELKLTRKELKRSADSQEQTQRLLDSQIQTQVKQQFESTYFSLLNQHNELLKEISRVRTSMVGESWPYITDAWHSARDKSSMVDACPEVFDQTLSYLKMLHEVLKFNAVHAPENKVLNGLLNEVPVAPSGHQEQMYADILKAHLDSKLLQLISLYGVYSRTQNTSCTFMLLIERYALLEGLSQELENLDEIFSVAVSNYKQSAFISTLG